MNDFLKPKISIIVPFYNEERFIGQCAESLLTQTMGDTELIFVNDGSDDNSLEILRSLVANDQRVRIYTNPKSSINRSRQFGVERSHGDYIMFVEPDDYLHTDACSILYHELVSSDVDILHYNSNIFDDIDDNVTEEVRKRARPFYGELVDEEIIYGCFGSRIYHHALWNKVFRASIVREAIKHLSSDYGSYAADYLAYFLIAMSARKYKGVHTEDVYYYHLSKSKIEHRRMTVDTIRTMCNISSVNDKLSNIVADSDNAPFYGELIKSMRASSLLDILRSWRRFNDYAEAGKAINVICDAFGFVATVQAIAELFHREQEQIATISLTSHFARRYALNNNRIGICYPRLRSGGTEVVTAALIKLWVSVGYDVVLFTDENPTVDDYAIPASVVRVVLPSVNGPNTDTLEGRTAAVQRQISELQRFIETLDVGVVVHNALYGEYFLYDVLCVKGCGIPIIGISHRAFASSLAWQFEEVFYCRDVFCILDAFVVLSRSDKALWDIFDINATYLPNPPAFDIRNLECSTLKDETVLWIGRISAEKRVFDALEIFSKVAQALPRAKLMIVGRGGTDAELAAAAARIKELALEDSVLICGYWKDTTEFYKGAAVYISTSANESFSMTLLESKGYGLPCVIYDLPNLELLNDERGVIRVEQKDVTRAADAIIALLEDYDYRSRVGRDARDSAVDFVSAIDLGSAWQSVFNELGTEKIQGVPESPPKNTLRRGLESIFGFCRAGLERRDAHFATPDSMPLNRKPAENIGIVPEEIARGMKKLGNMAVIKYVMAWSSAMEWARKTGPSAYSDINLTTRRLGHARRAIRILSVYAVAITVICVALFISTR